MAPSATVAGEVLMGRFASVWYNAVVRGDMNKIELNDYASIGDGSVVQTISSLPTGLSSEVYIG